MSANNARWLDRYPITKPEDADHLDTLAALKEFHQRLPRVHAEAEAHKEYVQDQLETAAAFHLAGMKAAVGAGDNDAAKKHGVMYGLALHRLGHPVAGEPPPGVASKVAHLADPVYKFKAHPADQFALDAISSPTAGRAGSA